MALSWLEWVAAVMVLLAVGGVSWLFVLVVCHICGRSCPQCWLNALARRLGRWLGHSLFRLVWRRRFEVYTLPGTGGSIQRREPRLVRVTGWRSCIWDMPHGQRERVLFEPFAGTWRGWAGDE